MTEQPIRVKPVGPGRAFELLFNPRRRDGATLVPVETSDLTGDIEWASYQDGVLIDSGTLEIADVILDTPLTGSQTGAAPFTVTAVALIPETACPLRSLDYLVRLTYTFTGDLEDLGPQDDWFLVPTKDVPEPE